MGLQVLSYSLIKNLSSSKKVNKILSIVKKGDVVMIEGRITLAEENELVSQALESVSGRFTGIEVAYLDSSTSNSTISKLKESVIKLLAKDRIGITVVGPSKIIKEIKMDPQKLEILFK